jgi:Co/Zn/Cd efflux system component
MLFGSIALVADGMHMSTHAGALLLAALAYTYARKYADDSRFTFGTGKLVISGGVHQRHHSSRAVLK